MPTRLKSLELQGYKTFASQTVFEFADTITAIVGPNGSGKSNIADALRWVLGEQSYSLLRGKKTEDMIFTGSEERPRAGMASATVLFDNSENWLPIDFSEVAITRRAYRDGQNEYLLNGQRVRLRDVSELLAASGLAERTYTIIGQGLVDAALALKAEDRRRLFEEAAGIELHRARREEAIRRLETTQRNLVRVQDILTELEPRLRSLERQARRAEEYERIKADLRVTLKEWYGYQWRRAQKDLVTAQETARIKEETLEKTRQGQASFHQKLTALRERIHDLRSQLNDWHRQSAQLHAHRASISGQLAVADERGRSLDEQHTRVSAEILLLEEEIDGYRERLVSIGQLVKQLETNLAEAQSQFQQARNALDEQVERRAQAEQEVQKTQRLLAPLSTNLVHLIARRVEVKAQVERHQAELEAMLEAITKAEAKLKLAMVKLEQHEQVLQKAENARADTERNLENQRKNFIDLENQEKEAADSLVRKQEEAARLRAQLDVLEQAESTLAGYASGARILLEAARTARLKGVRGAFSDSLGVPEGLESAIAAALGEYLDSILVENLNNAEEALEILSSASARAALLPLEAIKTQPVDRKFEEKDGIFGVAAKLVSSPRELKPAVDLLLGQVLVVRDRQVAQQVLTEVRNWEGNRGDSQNASWGKSLSCVTLNGEVYQINGPILVGSEAKARRLVRPRQGRDLQTRLAALETGIEEDHREIKEVQKKMANCVAKVERLGDAMRGAVEEERSARIAHSQLRLDVQNASERIKWLREQQIKLESDIAQGMVETRAMNDELENIKSQETERGEELRKKTDKLNSLQVDEFQIQVTHWETRAAVEKQAANGARARLVDMQVLLDRALETQNRLKNRLTDIESTREALESQKSDLLHRNAEIEEQIEASIHLIKQAEADLEQTEREEERLQEGEGEARQALGIAEHHYAQARIDLARSQDTLDALRHRIEDDFGLVALEYEGEMSGPTPLPLSGMVEQLPLVKRISPEVEDRLKRQRAMLRRMGPINPEAQAEFREVKERFDFLTIQVSDLKKADADLRQVIAELDTLMEREFYQTFEAVAEEFPQVFARLFGGGSARLILTAPDDLTSTGIDIEARLPGRREQGLSLLSGGERSLTAAALIFSLLRVSPTPFCVLDEVDAMLDDVNVVRFGEMLRELGQSTQFIIITHNRSTVQVVDVIYGVTMGRDSSSQVVSLKLEDVSKVVG